MLSIYPRSQRCTEIKIEAGQTRRCTFFPKVQEEGDRAVKRRKTNVHMHVMLFPNLDAEMFLILFFGITLEPG